MPNDELMAARIRLSDWKRALHRAFQDGEDDVEINSLQRLVKKAEAELAELQEDK